MKDQSNQSLNHQKYCCCTDISVPHVLWSILN